jgi:hypothetical protein
MKERFVGIGVFGKRRKINLTRWLVSAATLLVSLVVSVFGQGL